MKLNYIKPDSQLLVFDYKDILTDSDSTVEPTSSNPTGGIADTDNPGGEITP